MRTQRFSVRLSATVFLAFALLLVSAFAFAQETSLFSFYSSYGDALPIGALVSDSAGSLYGTTFYGGAYGNGMVYQLSPTASGWQQTVLHSFTPNGIDGFGPTSGVIVDSSGNIYGTTEFGGTGNCSNGFGCGTIFELSPAGNGIWKETILHDFAGSDGWQAYPGIVMDAVGNLYGMTTNGGDHSKGTVFELSPSSSGTATLTILHQFTGGTDGGTPYGGLTLDASGNLYGTTSVGGGKSSACRYGCGVAFELSPSQSGAWNETVLHNFTGASNDGQTPSGRLIFDSAGNLYGTASQGGGPSSAGIIFELSPAVKGKWIEKVIHNFNETAGDGRWPTNALTLDGAGNLYGVTLDGGTHGAGIAFRLSPNLGGWTETILNNFSRNGPGGYFPNGSLMLGSVGNLYGVTSSGGRDGQGAVYELAP